MHRLQTAALKVGLVRLAEYGTRAKAWQKKSTQRNAYAQRETLGVPSTPGVRQNSEGIERRLLCRWGSHVCRVSRLDRQHLLASDRPAAADHRLRATIGSLAVESAAPSCGFDRLWGRRLFA